QEDVAAKLTFINGRPAMCGCQVEYSDGGGEYSDVIYVTLCAKHSGSAILDLVATNRIALTPEYEGQWHADLYLDREIPLAKVEGATPAEAVLALMSAERIDPEQESVEQAGGDERAAFELFVRKHCGMPAHIAVNWDAKFTNDAWAGWQARAALAQPSPAPAEAERPEVVAYFDRNYPSTGDAFIWANYEGSPYEPVMTVAQHERIVGELRAESAKLSEALDECDGDRWKLRSERDAANARLHEVATACATAEQQRDAVLARVAELETALEPFAAVADAYDDSEDDDHEPYTDMGCDDRLRLTLGQHRAGRIALEGRTPQAQAQHSVPEGWKLVPVEPTEDVLEAIHNGGYVGDDQELRWFYQSILAAAPAPGGE
ncbi:hypothetical protein M0L66_007212, partial [Pseudomonas aeruginosa]|nr:hypothetical protein [Pseudomonas aeruginosa]EKX5072328.1 hypothetical protein [Pseudomonas aeruginosa]HBO3942754.1 hypothetical protein [Pseudomonas aeruginosa]HCF2691468.1 hypothetical protein [Pseudomonas aeruginosa]HCF2751190.1 hypothetical protein [Pseudomonas aeruginosa]